VVTITDVAKRAGVGLGTVSRVLNDSPRVSEETRSLVEDAIRDLDYHPSPLAQGLKRGRTHVIEVLVPFMTHPSAVERLRGIVPVLNSGGYTLVLRDVETPSQRDDHMRAMTRPHRADGYIIISLTPTSEEVGAFRDTETKVVLVDAHHDDLSSVILDDVKGGSIATRHLVELGHRDIAFIGDDMNNQFGFASSSDRCKGYEDVLASSGIEIRPHFIRTAPHGRASGRELATQLLKLDRPPTAIFASSDTQALGVIEAAEAEGVRVPSELSVVGFDDIDVAQYVGLTTIQQPLEASGRLAAELLMNSLSGESASVTHEYLLLELISRTTTAPPKARRGDGDA
jgi:LacI family transcriptional regulator